MRRRRPWRDERGAAAVEFAIISLPLILLALGVIEFGRAFNIQNDMAYAADVATRRLLLDGSTSATELQALVRDSFTGGQPEQLDLTLGTDGSGTITLQLTYPLTLSVPGVTSEIIRLTLERRIPAT